LLFRKLTVLITSRDLQYTADETRAIRLVSAEIQVFNPADWAKGIIDKLKVEGCATVSLSSGRNPCIAAFVSEKNVQSYLVLSLDFLAV
jgi:translation initiation factor 2A